VAIKSVDFQGAIGSTGTVTVAGGTLKLPDSSTGSGTVTLSGGVSVSTGTAVTKDVTINVQPLGKNGPIAVVDSSNTLATNGDIKGSVDSTIVVNGELKPGATTTAIEPKVVLSSGSTLTIGTTGSVKINTVDVQTGSKVTITSDAKRDSIHFGTFTECQGTIEIKLSTTTDAFISGPAKGTGVAFTYDSTNSASALAKCGVKVTDSAGVSTDLTSTTGIGRRLLGGGSANWGSDSMTFNMPNNNAANSASTLYSASVLAIVGLGLFFA